MQYTVAQNITLSNTVAITGEFIRMAEQCSFYKGNSIIVGSATGNKVYLTSLCSLTLGSLSIEDYFPGTTKGTIQAGVYKDGVQIS